VQQPAALILSRRVLKPLGKKGAEREVRCRRERGDGGVRLRSGLGQTRRAPGTGGERGAGRGCGGHRRPHAGRVQERGTGGPAHPRVDTEIATACTAHNGQGHASSSAVEESLPSGGLENRGFPGCFSATLGFSDHENTMARGATHAPEALGLHRERARTRLAEGLSCPSEAR
jgi:hypothetical protein